MSETQYIEILVAVIGLFLGWVGWGLKRLASKVDALFEHRMECVKAFADRQENKESHARIYSRLDDHELRISRLEGKRVNPGARQVHDD